MRSRPSSPLARGRSPLYGRPMPHSRRGRCTPLATLVATALLLGVPAAPAVAFDTGPHSDLTRDAMTAEGFGRTAAGRRRRQQLVRRPVLQLVEDPPVGAREDERRDPRLALRARARTGRTAVLDGAGRMHFDSSIWDVFDVRQAAAEWDRLQRATAQAMRSIKNAGGVNREIADPHRHRHQPALAAGLLLALQLDREAGRHGRRRHRLVEAHRRPDADVVRRADRHARDAQRLHRRLDRSTRSARTAPGTPTATGRW